MEKFSFLKISEEILKFRWVFALFIFIILVFFKINFSSIGAYNDIFPTVISEEQKKEHEIFGKPRPIRSDEWMVHTPKYLAQQGNNFEIYSNKGSISKINTVVDYYAPAKDITLIGKPFNLGYILFGKEYGLSFYFCMLEILLFMTAFEMFLILTKRRILISTIGMLFVGFSPAMQWWLIPHITIVFVYAMSLFCLGYYFFTTYNIFKKIILSLLSISAIIGFCLSIFPCCQVVCGLIDIILLIFVLIRDKKNIYFNKSSIYLMLFIFSVSFGIIFNFIFDHKEDFLALLNTDYPGNRLWCGGNKRLEDVFCSLTSIFLPYKDVEFSNNCEVSTFIHFAPIFILLYGKIIKRLKEDNDSEIFVGSAIFYSLIVEIIFMCIGFSEVLAKITLFKYANRMELCYGFTATIFTVWCFYIIWKKKDIFNKYECFLYAFLYGLMHLTMVNLKLKEYFPLKWLCFEISLFVLILLFAFFKRKKLTSISVLGVMFCSGGFVNPICRGISPITNHPISRFVEEKVEENKEDLWLCLGGESVLFGNFIMANGARVLSTTHYYPDYKQWELLKIDEQYYNIFNRYAHNKFFIKKGKNKIKLEHSDTIEIHINPETLKLLNIKYIVARKNYIDSIKSLIEDKYKKQFEQDDILVLIRRPSDLTFNT